MNVSPSIFVYLAQDKEFLPASLFNCAARFFHRQAYWTLVVPRKQPSNSPYFAVGKTVDDVFHCGIARYLEKDGLLDPLTRLGADS